MRVEVVRADALHVVELCEDLREREYEAFAKLGEDACKAIMREMARSFATWAGVVDGRVAALWGARVDGLLSDEAYVWMICGHAVEEHPMVFLRHSRRALRELLPYFKQLHGLVLADFGCSVRWLEWLGFDVKETVNGVRPFVLKVGV